MYTFQDLQALGENENKRMNFIMKAVENHKSSEDYKTAVNSEMYMNGENPTITNYQKVLYTLAGNAVPDNFSANYKCKNAMFPKFLTQQVVYLLKNGVTFEHDETYKRLGEEFQDNLIDFAESALCQKVAFGFFNLDHVDFFKFTEFVPLWDEETGGLRSGIRFWQIDTEKPQYFTLYEEDGYTRYIKRQGQEMEVKEEKKAYIVRTKSSVIDGEYIYSYENYPTFPIVPLWGNKNKKSALVGHQEKLDAYDLIESGFANDLDDISQIYWTLKNSGGMSEIDLAKFVERMKTIHAFGFDSDDDQEATAHTVEIPHEAREKLLNLLRDDLYKDFMALDVEKIAAGNVTATQIIAAYESLDEKAFKWSKCVTKFIRGIFKVAGIEDSISYNVHRIVNEQEVTMMILAAAEHLDEETILEKLPFINDDEVNKILKRKAKEQTERFPVIQNKEPDEPGSPQSIEE